MDIDLKQVFSILDENDEGQIQLRRFVDVANNYYSDAEQLARITKALDPKNTGFINFEQFCKGIAQISSLQGLTLKEVACDLTRRSRENSLVEDSDRRSLNQDGSTTTFIEYDFESDEAFRNNHKLPAGNNRTPNNNTQTVNLFNQNSNNNNNQSSPRLDSPFYRDDEEYSGVAESSPTSFPSETVFPRTTSQRISQTLKRNSYLRPTIPSEPTEQQLQETVEELQKTVDILDEEKKTTTERLSKFQSENSELRSRLAALEDRFQDLEGQQARTTQSEKQKYAELITHKDRTFLQEKEILQSSVMRINAIEADLKQTNSLNNQMKKDVKELKQKLDDVDVQLHDSQVQCNHLAEDNKKLLEQLRIQREELESEKLTNAQLAEQLTLESSRKIFGRTLTRTESILKTSETRIQDLDAQVRALKLENEKLKHENDELRERAFVAGIDEGRRLMANPDTPSYAAELEVLSKDELMSKLRDQFSINDRLREYIERMLTVIIENSPQLLEVTTSSGVSIGSMGFSSNNCSQQKKETKTVQSENLSSTIITNKEPADKYCRLS